MREIDKLFVFKKFTEIMELFQNQRKLLLAITLFVYLDSVTAQPGSILWAYVRRFAPNFEVKVINNTAVIEITTPPVNTSISSDIRRSRIKKALKVTNKIPQSTKGEIMAQETMKDRHLGNPTKKIRDLAKKIKGDSPPHGKKYQAKQNVSDSTEEDNQDTENTPTPIEKEHAKSTEESDILTNRPVLRAKQHQKESAEVVYETQVTKLNGTEPVDNALDSEEHDKKPLLRAKKHKKTTVETEASSSLEMENEQTIGQNETSAETPKDGLRTGPDKDDKDADESKVTKKLRFRAKHKVTEMPLNMQEDHGKPEDYPNIGRTRNEQLNPYAINRQMKRFVEENSGRMNIKMEVVGRTVEYNDIILMKISEDEGKIFRSHKYAKEVPEKKIIFIVHGLSILGMGELIRDETMFKTLMDSYTQHLDHFDIFVIPMANPDGFAAILNSQVGKFWNKNMSPQSNCAGVALDRNFDVEWNSSSDISSCSHVYPGPIPFSEAETRAIREVFHLFGHKIVAYIHVHASTYHSKIFKGDAILHPKGYSTDHNDDDKYIEIKADIEDAMKNASFKVLSVTVEPLFRWYGIVTGSSVDFAATVYGIPYAMEFCMQSYTHLEHDALYHIWRRIIDASFESIWRSVNNPNTKKK